MERPRKKSRVEPGYPSAWRLGFFQHKPVYRTYDTTSPHLPPPPPPPPLDEVKCLQTPGSHPPPPPLQPPPALSPPPPPPPLSAPQVSRHQETMNGTSNSSLHNGYTDSWQGPVRVGLTAYPTLSSTHFYSPPEHIRGQTYVVMDFPPPPPPPLCSPPTHVPNELPSTISKFAMPVELEKLLYNDVLYIVVSFLQIEEMTSSMRVSKTFARNAHNARANAKHLMVKCSSNHQQYLTSVMTHCKMINYIEFLHGTTLTVEDIKRLLHFYADQIVGVVIGGLRSVCSRSKANKDLLCPISCGDYMLRFIAETLKNVEDVRFYGCFRETDFMAFAKKTNSLRSAMFGLGKHRFHNGRNMNYFLKGLAIFLQRNQFLTDLSLWSFAGSGDILLNADLKALTNLHLFWCDITPDMKVKIARRFPKLKVNYK